MVRVLKSEIYANQLKCHITGCTVRYALAVNSWLMIDCLLAFTVLCNGNHLEARSSSVVRSTWYFFYAA